MRFKNVAWWIDWTATKVRAHDAAGASIHEADSLSDLKGRVSGPAVILLGRRTAFIRSARLPNAKASDIRSIVGLQAAQLFPHAQGELAYSFHLTNETNADGRLALLAAAPVNTLERIVVEAASVGIKVVAMLPAAIGSAALAEAMQAPDAAIVEPTLDGVSIEVVAHGELVYSRLAPPGSDLSLEVQRAFAAAAVAKAAVIAPEELRFGQRDIVASQSGSALLRANAAQYETLILEPPAAVAKRDRTLIANRARLAVLVALAAIGVGAVVWDGRDREQQMVLKQRAEFANSLRSWSKRRDAESAYAAKQGALAVEIRRAFQPAQNPTDVLAVVGNSIPKGVWLTGINFERGKPLLLRGTATSNEAVGVYLDALTSNERFRDVKLVFANQALIETSNVVQFSMSAHVVGNLPPIKTKQERSRK